MRDIKKQNNSDEKFSKWIAVYSLSNEIVCENKNHNRKNIEFITKNIPNPKQYMYLTITGFKITINNLDHDAAMNKANCQADNLVNFLSASSGSYSTVNLLAFNEIKKSGMQTISKSFGIKYNIVKPAILDISDENFLKILEGDYVIFKKKFFHVSNAFLADHYQNYSNVIKELILAMNKQNKTKYSKYRYLRNMLSHSNDKLWQPTEESINKNFKEVPFKFINGQYDATDLDNRQKIKQHAGEFLNLMHDEIRDGLKNLK